MIKKLLLKISKDLYHSENRTSNLRKYAHMRKHEGWQVHQKFMVAIGNSMSEYLLSEKFTNLDMQEKDAQQRALNIAKEIIDFLFDPMKGMTNYIRATQQGATTGQPKRKSQGE